MNRPHREERGDEAKTAATTVLAMPPVLKSPPSTIITTKYERYMKRFIEGGDRAAMLQLLRNHDSVASYFCQGAKDLEPYSLWHGDLVGIFDIVFLAVDPHHHVATTPSNSPTASISRVVKGGTLALVSKQQQQPQTGIIGGSLDQQQRRLVYGTIQGVTATQSGRGSSNHNHLHQEEERNVQELSFEFCQAPINPLFQEGVGDCTTKFRVTRVNGKEVGMTPPPSNHHNHNHGTTTNMVTSYGILTQPGRFGWSPIETRVDYQEDMDYVDFMQKEMERRYYYGNYKWKEEHSWLCRYMGLPKEAALAIHAFNYHPIPPPYFQWQPGDLLLSIRLDQSDLDQNLHQQQHTKFSSSSCSSYSSHVYLARPRDPNRLLRKIQDRYPKLQLQEQAQGPFIHSHQPQKSWLEEEDCNEEICCGNEEVETDDESSSCISATNSDTDTDITDVVGHDDDDDDDDGMECDDDDDDDDANFCFVDECYEKDVDKVKNVLSHNKRPRHY